MCRVVIEVRRPTGERAFNISEMMLSRSSQRNSLGLTVQPCILVTAGRRTCGAGQWSSQVDSTSGDWKGLIRQVKEMVDTRMADDDRALELRTS